ncbi:nitrate reductase molybdenum cofactor assembly chaperone [Brevibacillus sp. SYSU BS000544]|uniref:nitrate reductase molybdenum cofactor assembly chaperone n=1 Tax=Brevibacillus sp. SYSU BS000544 TaxID=3416443 RepID=UPI003CE52703
METAEREAILDSSDSIHAFRLLSILLDYPDQEGFDLAALQEEVNQLAHPKIAEHLQKFMTYLGEHAREDVAAIYVDTFDFHSQTSIYLTQSVNSDEREDALEQLRKTYEEIGLFLQTDELPDYLPLVLEFVTLAPYELASELLIDFYPVIQDISHLLNQTDNPYAWVIEACRNQIDQFLFVVEKVR